MTLAEDDKRVPLYLEAVPPPIAQGESGIETVLEKIAAVHESVGLDGVNIPEIREETSKSDRGERLKPFEPRVEPRQLALRVRERFGIECMINRVVVHLEASRQADWFRETWQEFGVRQFVLVGGEKSGERYPGPTVPEANVMLREVIDDPALRIGNICIPTRRNEAARMARKLETGIDFFTSQIIYHPEEVTSLLDALAGTPLPGEPPCILLTLCPVKSARNIRFLHWLGVSLSPELERWLTRDVEGVSDRSIQQIEDAWRVISEHRRLTRCRFPAGISLAPIGKIPNATTVALARALVGTGT